MRMTYFCRKIDRGLYLILSLGLVLSRTWAFKTTLLRTKYSSRYPKSRLNVVESTATNESTHIYFDIGLDTKEEMKSIGRLVFNLYNAEEILPLHTRNLVKLCTGEMRAIDQRCSYLKCQFKFSPQFVETFPQYRWGHIVDGKGRNAEGRPNERIQDPENLNKCKHEIYGGTYYGLKYDEELLQSTENGVILTVPLVGAYRGSTSFSIVRVGESPMEWKERLLLNSAVIGGLESGIEVLHEMARQTNGPPTILSSGKL